MINGATTPALLADILILSTVSSYRVQVPKLPHASAWSRVPTKQLLAFPAQVTGMMVRSQLAVVHTYSAVPAPDNPLTCSPFTVACQACTHGALSGLLTCIIMSITNGGGFLPLSFGLMGDTTSDTWDEIP